MTQEPAPSTHMEALWKIKKKHKSGFGSECRLTVTARLFQFRRPSITQSAGPVCQNTPHHGGILVFNPLITSDERRQEMWNMKSQWGWEPADAQDDGTQMGARVKCLHVANSHLPVNPEPREMLNTLLMMEEKRRNE